MDLIDYYDQLNEISNQKRKDLQKHIDKLKRDDFDSTLINDVRQLDDEEDEEESSIQTRTTDKFSVEELSSANSNETFTSALSESPIKNEDDTADGIEMRTQKTVSETEQKSCAGSLDVINANSAGI